MADFTPHEAPMREAHALPVMLPTKLVGRDVVLGTLYNHLRQNMPVLIYGPTGIGKTALAAKLADAYTELPGGVLWIQTNHPTLATLLTHVGRAYRVPEISTSENPMAMIGAVANTLQANKPLIVIDGQIDAAVAQEFITRCADELPVVLVSDEQLVGPWTAIPLGKLEPKQAAQMFKHVAGMDGSDGEENDADIDNLMQVLDFNPFAIATAAGTVRANKQTPAQFLAGIPRQPGVSGQLLALTASFKALNNALQGLMLMMGATLSGEASTELISMISGAPQEGIQQAMTMLAQRQLVTKFPRYNSMYYRLHPITYTFTQPLLRGSGKLEALREKVRDTVISYARTYSAATPPAYDHLAMEMDTFLAVARWAVDQHGDRDAANQLAVALMQAGDFVNQRGYVYELLTLRRLAASSTSAFPAHPGGVAQPLPYEEVEEEEEELEGEETELDMLPYDDLEDEEADEEAPDELDEAEDELDAVEDADFDATIEEDEEDEEEAEAADEDAEIEADEEAEPLPPQEPVEITRLRASLAQARQQANRYRQSEILTQMAQLQAASGMETEAIASYSEALSVYEALEDQKGVLSALDQMAALAAKTENSQAAVLHATRGIQLAEQLGERERQLHLLTTLGDARQQLGESEQAMGAYSLALDFAQQLGKREDEAQVLMKLGFAQLDENEPQAAIETWEKALSMFKEQGKRDLEGRVLGGLGTAYGELERWQEAIAFHMSALHIAREVGDKDEEALQLGNLGYASVQAKQLGQAVLRYRQALHLAYQQNNRDNIVSTIVDLAQLLVESPRHLRIAELIVNDALRIDPLDRDVKRLKERIEDELEAQEDSVEMLPVSGTAQDYASNAYTLLEA